MPTLRDITHQINHEQLKKLRHEIHQHPELSHQEEKTADRLKRFLKPYEPTRLIEGIAGAGFIAIWEFADEGPTVLFRCELDALPIHDINDIPYKSTFANVGHKCGHDGHMTSVAGLAPLLQKHYLQRGRVMLLFQPAEETGEGAAMMFEDEKMRDLKPDFVFAFHNMPGYPLGQVLTKEGPFAPASAGIEIFLEGATSHAGEPERGNNPALPMTDIIRQIAKMPQEGSYDGFVLTTVIHALLGEIAFGISPGHAEVRATLRAHLESDMEWMKQRAEDIVQKAASANHLQHRIAYREVFPAVSNDSEALKRLQSAINHRDLSHRALDEPVRWSEDFGHFTNRFPGVLFGLGSGVEQPALHNADYDYPDELLPIAVGLFYQVAHEVLNG